MDRGDSQPTRLSLLGRLRRTPGDESAWDEFVARYGPKIRAWCLCWRLQEADADDVTQAVLVRLAAKMRTFVYDPSGSFRAWLKTLTRHAWYDLVNDRGRGGSGDSQVLAALHTVAARDELEARLAEAFDLELLEAATANVKSQVEERTWEAFRLTALEGLSGAEAAARLGMSVTNVFKAKSNVQKRLREEVELLERQGP
jgi:RNA polymerase sigma-70 factor (ECF subfamily)